MTNKSSFCSDKEILTFINSFHQNNLAELTNSIIHQEKFKPTNRLIRRLSTLHNVDIISSDEITRIEKEISSQYSFKLSLSQSNFEQRNSFEQLTPFPHLEIPLITASGISINVASEQRSQIRFDFNHNNQNQVFAHYLLKNNFSTLSELYIAIRWIHLEADEEVIIRFRNSSIVVGKSVEIPVNFNDNYNLLTVSRIGDLDVIFLNGFPIFYRISKTTFPSGVTFDFIGSTQIPCTCELPLFAISHEYPKFYCDFDIQTWYELLLKVCIICSDLNQLCQTLYSFEGLKKPLGEEIQQLIINLNTKKALGYKDYITDAVLNLLPKDKKQQSISNLVNIEPSPIMEVNNLSVEISSNPSERFSLSQLFRKTEEKVKLLNNINFRAYAGDVIGILGKNGAGKSTFLKTLVGSMPISTGRVSVDGKPILLRPGAGMQGDLTGRENILKTGLYMGFLPDELYAMMDDIISFAELEKHIDRPFRYYSDGMKARLIFSLATAVHRDILLLDELLSAGDMGFQRKAMERLDSFIASSKLVFVVQHTFDFVLSKCTKCLLLENGRPIYFGDPKIATEIYKESL